MIYTNELSHHGVLGQRWGRRRYQNPDGSLTEEGRKRYSGNHTNDNNASSFKSDAKYKKALSVYNDYTSGKKVSIDKRFDTAQKLFEIGDDLRDMYSDTKMANEIYKKAEKLSPSKQEWENHKKQIQKKNKNMVKKYGNVSMNEMNTFMNNMNDVNRVVSMNNDIAIRAARQNASLSVSQGLNPHMF